MSAMEVVTAWARLRLTEGMEVRPLMDYLEEELETLIFPSLRADMRSSIEMELQRIESSKPETICEAS